MRIKIKATVYSAQEGLLEPRFTLHMDRTIIIYFDQFNFLETFKVARLDFLGLIPPNFEH